VGQHNEIVSRLPVQLFYWDYVIGLILAALIWGVTLGSMGGIGRLFVAYLLAADSPHIALAITGGILFNVANLLLVATIEIAGLAVAFPVGIGLALVVGAISSYIISPRGNTLMRGHILHREWSGQTSRACGDGADFIGQGC